MRTRRIRQRWLSRSLKVDKKVDRRLPPERWKRRKVYNKTMRSNGEYEELIRGWETRSAYINFEKKGIAFLMDSFALEET